MCPLLHLRLSGQSWRRSRADGCVCSEAESQGQLFRIRCTEQRSSERAVDSRFPSEAQRILGAIESSGVARAAVLLDASG